MAQGMKYERTFEKVYEQLTAEESSLRAVIDHINNPIWIIDAKGKLILLNRFLKDSLQKNLNLDIIPGINPLDFLPENIRPFWEDAFFKVLNGETFHHEYTIHFPDGEYWSEISGNPVKTGDGTIQAGIFLAQDITHLKKAEEALRDSEEKFRELAESISDSFVLFDYQKILYINPAFEKIYNRKREDVIHHFSSHLEWIYPEDRERILSYIKSDEYKDKRIFDEQYRIIIPDGPPRWIWHRSYPIRNREGNIYRFVHVSSDISVQKELERKLLLNRTQQKALLDNIPHMAWLKDNHGRYILVNESFARKYKRSIDDILGKNDFELFPEERARYFIAQDQDVVKSGKQKHIEKRSEKNGRPSWSETYKTPIFNEKKELIGITGISIDITERKMLEEEIRVNEELFRSLLQFSSDALTILNEKGEIIFESSLEGKISGFSISELLGTQALQLVHPDDQASFENSFQKVVKFPGLTIKTEFRGIRKSGSYVFIEAIFANHLDNPKIRGIVMNSRDITARKIAEQKEHIYRESQVFLGSTALDFLSLSVDDDPFHFIGEKLSLIARKSVILVSSIDETGKTMQLEYAHGLEPYLPEVEKLLERSLHHISFPIPPEYVAILTQNSRNLIRLNGGIFEAAMGQIPQEICTKIEKSLDLKAVYAISMLRQGKLLGSIALLVQDDEYQEEKQTIETFSYQASIALHRRQLELELIHAKTKAEESDKIKTTFLANMSHEIRTPMNGILGFAQLLSQPNLSREEVKEYTEAINSNGKLLINLINDIIDISRIEAGQLNIALEPVDVNKIMDQIYHSLVTDSVRSEKSEVNFILEKERSNETVILQTDPFRLGQVLTNLLANAIKFTCIGEIVMGYRIIDEDRFEFYVKDTGIGIPKEKQQIIFERFMQADPSTTRKFGGSGLGLSISKGFIELMGGEIFVDSEPGKGSRFWFTLPLYTTHKQVLQISQTLDMSAQIRKSTVLVVEDDRFSSKYLDTLLRKHGIETLLAFHAKEAIDFIHNHPEIDLVLMDIQLPEISGYEATQQIKSLRPELPIIAQTANAYEDDRQRCLDAGCDEYLSKPISSLNLFKVLEKYLGKS